MEFGGLVLLVVFLVLLVLRVPISFSIGFATLVTMLLSMDAMPAVTTLAQRMANGLNSFALLAIPFFVLSGVIMGQGGIARRLIDFAMAYIGMLPGGLALVNVVSCALFGGISGSAVATTSAIGSFMIPEMERKGYDRNFSTAVTTAAATTGMVIPPSNILIVFAIASGGVSISALFVAGYLPGLLVAFSLMLVCATFAKVRGYPVMAALPFKEVIRRTGAAMPALFMVVLVMGGIISGLFTATEAGAIAVVYSLALAMGVYRQIRWSELSAVLLKTAEVTAIVMMLIAVSSAMSWILAYENIPQLITQALLGISDNPIILLLIINLMLLFIGAFMDTTPAVLIFTPILLPVAESLGMSPLHFGIMLVMNLSIGLCSPPVGSVLFVGCSVGKASIARVIPPLLPLYMAMFVALMIVTYVPAVSEWLPTITGLYQ
ncbi:uncharacterized protein HMF8227_02581 [Saliniradius amylolyticus]|uniref:TRAP transporter large permease protein n=1 Tax=Saliniradius amylolyticus TaxID=2183582 RepID=A0A2S2E5X1_9ALTE|nr:TRAP transporter large permease [Saliniradius amylolyticus]AWL13033.1 uncharacterized protein HMF8227_02581 [Saliniradius amylolyticus]